MHRTATMRDERYAVTEAEREEIVRKYFPEGSEGPITEFPNMEKPKIVILTCIMQRFDDTKRYSESEVNDILKTVHADYVTLRRHLIEYGFLDRQPDGSAYWVKK